MTDAHKIENLENKNAKLQTELETLKTELTTLRNRPAPVATEPESRKRGVVLDESVLAEIARKLELPGNKTVKDLNTWVDVVMAELNKLRKDAGR